jgi:hypothetical protein
MIQRILNKYRVPHMREKPEFKGLVQKKDLHSRLELVWNPQPHV